MCVGVQDKMAVYSLLPGGLGLLPASACVVWVSLSLQMNVSVSETCQLSECESKVV